MNSRLLNVVARREGSANGLLLYIADVHRKALVAFVLRGRSITVASDHFKNYGSKCSVNIVKNCAQRGKKATKPLETFKYSHKNHIYGNAVSEVILR